MNELLASAPWIIITIGMIAIGIAAILMPLFVIAIYSSVSQCQRTLAAMEKMMRHGK